MPQYAIVDRQGRIIDKSMGGTTSQKYDMLYIANLIEELSQNNNKYDFYFFKIWELHGDVLWSQNNNDAVNYYKKSLNYFEKNLELQLRLAEFYNQGGKADYAKLHFDVLSEYLLKKNMLLIVNNNSSAFIQFLLHRTLLFYNSQKLQKKNAIELISLQASLEAKNRKHNRSHLEYIASILKKQILIVEDDHNNTYLGVVIDNRGDILVPYKLEEPPRFRIKIKATFFSPTVVLWDQEHSFVLMSLDCLKNLNLTRPIKPNVSGMFFINQKIIYANPNKVDAGTVISFGLNTCEDVKQINLNVERLFIKKRKKSKVGGILFDLEGNFIGISNGQLTQNNQSIEIIPVNIINRQLSQKTTIKLY